MSVIFLMKMQSQDSHAHSDRLATRAGSPWTVAETTTPRPGVVAGTAPRGAAPRPAVARTPGKDIGSVTTSIQIFSKTRNQPQGRYYNQQLHSLTCVAIGSNYGS